MGSIKKSQEMIQDSGAAHTFRALSKAALTDLVVDLLRQREGKENLDGQALVATLLKAYGPVAALRGDKLPAVCTSAQLEAKIAKKTNPAYAKTLITYAGE